MRERPFVYYAASAGQVMAKKNRMSVLKRQREARKAEKAALKRERRQQRKDLGPQDPSRDDLAGYLGDDEPEVLEEEEEEQPAPQG